MTVPDRERLMAYLDGELPPLERTAVERELEASEEARRLLAELAALDALARSQPVEAPDGYFEALPGRVRARLEAGGQRRRALPAWTWAAAAAVAVAALAPLTLSRLGEAPPPAAVPPVGRVAGDVRPPVTLTGADPAGDEARASAPEPIAEAAPRAQGAPVATPAPTRAPPSAAPLATPAPERRRAARPAPVPEAARPAERGDRPAEPPRAGFSAAPRAADRAEAEAEEATAPPPPAAAVASALDEGRAAEAEAGEPRPSVARAKRQTAGVAVGADAERFTRLAARRPRTAEEARSLREDWRGFVLLYPESALADEARVRTVETGLEAWRLGDRQADRRIARRDAEAYLGRDDAAQTGRVEALLAALERTPQR